MSFLSQLFKGGNQSKEEVLLRKHLSEIEEELEGLSNSKAIKKRLSRASSQKITSFVLKTLKEGIFYQSEGMGHFRNGKTFGNLLVVVSVVPSNSPERVRSFIGRSSLSEILNLIVNDFGTNFDHNKGDLAYWICTHQGDKNSFYLTWIPSVKFRKTNKGFGGVYARKFMTDEEMARIGLNKNSSILSSRQNS